jgi:hypothetical protein
MNLVTAAFWGTLGVFLKKTEKFLKKFSNPAFMRVCGRLTRAAARPGRRFPAGFQGTLAHPATD